ASEVFGVPAARCRQAVVHGSLHCCDANHAAATGSRGQVEKKFATLSATRQAERIMEVMERSTATPRFGVAIARTSADVASAIHALTDVDLLRLKALARLWSRGLPGGLGWTDVLHEAIARVLDGSRPWPAHVPILAFLSGVMRSICDDHWRRVRHEQRLLVSRDDRLSRDRYSDEIDEVP